MIQLFDRFKYLGLFLIGVVVIGGFWWSEKDFMFTTEAKKIDLFDRYQLSNSLDEYVEITNACLTDHGVFSSRDSFESHTIALSYCDNPFSVSHLFIQMTNSGFKSIEKKMAEAETGEYSLFTGQLLPYNPDYQEQYLFNNSGMDIDGKGAFLVKLDRQPENSLFLFKVLTISLIAILLVMGVVFYYFFDRPKKNSPNS